MIDDFYNERVDIVAREMGAQDDVGGTVTVKQVAFPNVACCIQTDRQSARTVQDTEGAEVGRTCWISPKYAGLIDRSMLVRHRGTEYEVIGVDDPQHRYQHVVLQLREIEGGEG